MKKTEAQEITAIQIGWGESSTYYSTDEKVSEYHKVDSIKESFETVMIGGANTVKIKAFNGYKGGKLIFTIFTGQGISIYYN